MTVTLYRLALRAFPRRHRDLYQAEMIDAFERELARRRERGPGAAARFVVAAGLNAVLAGLAERRRRHVVRFGSAFCSLDVTVGLVMLSVIALSAAGIYSLMSFTVAKRRREIGVRAALGADRRHLLLGVFSRALWQLGAGAVAGTLGAIGLGQMLEGDMLQGRGAVIVPLVALVMATVGVLAAVGPAREGLRIQPTEALRDE